MFRSRFLQTVITVCICAVLIVSLAPPTEAKSKYTITALGAWFGKTYMMGNFLWFVEHANKMAAEKYPGQLEIDYIGGPKKIPQSEQMDALKNGFIDMLFTNANLYAPAVPLVNGLALSDYTPWEERQKGVNDLLQPYHKDYLNVYFLSRMGRGMPYQIYSTKPIENYRDMKGLRLRASPLLIPFAKDASIVIKVQRPPAILKGLQNDQLDGVIWPKTAIVDWKWEKAIKYMVEPVMPFGGADVLLMNWDAWNGLPKHLQALLIAAVTDAEKQLMRRAENFMTEKYAYLKKSGVQTVQFSEEDAKRLHNTCRETVWEQLVRIDPQNARRLRDMITK